MDWDLQTYYPILVFLLFILAFIAGAMIAAHAIGPRRRTAVKLMPMNPAWTLSATPGNASMSSST